MVNSRSIPRRPRVAEPVVGPNRTVGDFDDSSLRDADVRELERYHGYLAINRNDLDISLVRQAELFWHVSNRHALAIAARDTTRLELEEATSEEDAQLREDAIDREEKITEASLQLRVKTVPRIKALQRAYIDSKLMVDRWAALEKAYQQRAYMLRELVATYLSRLGRFEPRTALAEFNRKEAHEDRRRRSGDD